MADPRELAAQAFTLLQDALRESETRAAELSEQLNSERQPKNRLEEQLEVLQHQLEIAEAEREHWKREAGQLEEVLDAERSKLEQLKKRLDVAESGPEKLTRKEINFWRTKVDEFDESSREYRNRLAQLRNELKARDEQIEKFTDQEGKLQHAAAESNEQLSALGTEVERIRETLKEREARIAHLSAEVEQARTELRNREEEQQQLRSELNSRENELEQALHDAREQIAGLEGELREEKECTDNLSEVANERRELITKLEDKLAEAEERHEEAKWRLGKAEHFERLVRRRKGLIDALIERIRAKNKANTALKAGLDGLRTYKAASAAKQHKLLIRIDSLKAKVREQEETISRHHGATMTKEQLAASEMRVAELESRLTAQVEIIQTLEDELKTSKALKKTEATKNSELERLQRELDAKSTIIGNLQDDADEQQRKLAKLRGSESETLRLKAISEQNLGHIDSLEREIAQLRNALERKSTGADQEGEAAAALASRIKEQEATIAELTESVDAWKRKYEFLSTDAPDAYRTAAEK